MKNGNCLINNLNYSGGVLLNIKTVTVIGANGTMGKNIAGIFASFGNAKVYMVCRTLEKAQRAKQKAINSVRSDSIANNLIPCTYDNLNSCLAESDLVFDSIIEDLCKKKELNQKISRFVNEHAIVCTGTSGLSINELASVFSDKIQERYLGLHMFNPPYNMTLCEIIPNAKTKKEIVDFVKQYAEKKLLRTIVETKDTPAFLGNRIGFQCINEAMQYAVLYKDNGGIDYIDTILGPFTGRNMAPLNTADFVGLDVHMAIVDNLYNNTVDYAHDTFLMPQFVGDLVKQGKLGRKTGQGLYRISNHTNGKKKYEVYDIAKGTYRKQIEYHFPFKSNMIGLLKIGNYQLAIEALVSNKSLEAQICVEFMLKYIIYSLFSARLVGNDIHIADDVMACGYNWVPPLSLIESFGGVQIIQDLAKERLPENLWNSIGGDRFFKDIPVSKYDYRKFFKAK